MQSKTTDNLKRSETKTKANKKQEKSRVFKNVAKIKKG